MDVIARIQELREERGWSNYQLAKKAGLSQSTMTSAMNRGNNVTVQTIQKCCEAFGVTMAEFFDDSLRIKELSLRERKLVEGWRKLPSEIQSATELVILYGSSLADEEKDD